MISKSGFSKEMKDKLKITDNLIRLAIGIEDVDDLINDLNQALNSMDSDVKTEEHITNKAKLTPKF